MWLYTRMYTRLTRFVQPSTMRKKTAHCARRLVYYLSYILVAGLRSGLKDDEGKVLFLGQSAARPRNF